MTAPDRKRGVLESLTQSYQNMRGDHASAASHIRSGAKLLREALDAHQRHALQLEAKSQSDYYIPLEILASIFAGLDNEVAKVGLIQVL